MAPGVSMTDDRSPILSRDPENSSLAAAGVRTYGGPSPQMPAPLLRANSDASR